MNTVMYSAQRGLAMGMKYGMLKGFRAYHSDEATPVMDETAMQGAIGIIIAVGGVLIALYIIAVVVGSISYAVTSGNIKLSPTWNSTITNLNEVEKMEVNRLDENRCKSVRIENGRLIGREHRFAGASHLQPRKRPAYRHYRGGDPDDCDRSICRSWYLDILDTTHNIFVRTSTSAVVA